MQDGTYLIDKDGNSYATIIRAERILYDGRSEFQRIMVIETQDLGRVLMLDDVFNVCPLMEAFYHEPMAHIPIAMMDTPSPRVLIIGGGDFGVAHHLLKHSHLKSLVQCELDPEILKVCREFFPEWAACEKDPRISTVVGDGFDFLEKSEEGRFDAIIIDSTDPYLGDPSPLITDEFYKRARRALSSGGVLMQIIADGLFYPDTWSEVIPKVRHHFESVAPLFLPIPFYATGSWGLMLAGKDREHLDPGCVSQIFLDGTGGIETMTPELVRGWFSLPPYIARNLQPLLD